MPTHAEETLADEQRRRVQAGVAAFAAGILTLGGATLFGYATRDRPVSPSLFIDALSEQLRGAPPPGFKARQVLFYDDQALVLILVSAVLALAAIAMGVALVHLYHSTKARRPELNKGIKYAAMAGGGLAIFGLVQATAVAVKSSEFAGSADQSAEAARDALAFPLLYPVVILRYFGLFALGLAFVLLALNAMRVGLLTRFMGVLGIIVGALFVVPLGSSDIVQSFWMVGLGLLFLGRWPGGPPPAWVTGEAQPWPTQQEIREAKLARREERMNKNRPTEKGTPRLTKDRPTANGVAPAPAPAPRRRRERAEPPETPAPQVPERKPHSSSKKRKRRRR